MVEEDALVTPRFRVFTSIDSGTFARDNCGLFSNPGRMFRQDQNQASEDLPPPTEREPVASPSQRRISTGESETATEKRRRLAAFGVNRIDDSDSASGAEDEDASRIAGKDRRPEPEPTADDRGRPRVQWGGEISRERAALVSVSWESLARGNLTAQSRFEGLFARRK